MAIQSDVTQVSTQSPTTRRSSMEVMCDILEVVSGGMERPTHIIYRANISWKVLNTCLVTLVSKGLVAKENDGKRDIYQLTANGYSALALYRDLRSRLTKAEGSVVDEVYARDF